MMRLRPCCSAGLGPIPPQASGTMAQELEGTGVTANVLVPGGATYTNLTYSGDPNLRNQLIRPEVMQEPVVWLASNDSGEFNGRRIIAYNWDESLEVPHPGDQVAPQTKS